MTLSMQDPSWEPPTTQCTAMHSLPFKRKLFDMLCDEENREAITWTADGTAFQVIDAVRLENDVLPKHFKHSRFSSFIRQLNFYNFQKVSRERSLWLYSHALFQRDRPDLLQWLKRKTHTDFVTVERELEKQQKQHKAHTATLSRQRRVVSTRHTPLHIEREGERESDKEKETERETERDCAHTDDESLSSSSHSASLSPLLCEEDESDALCDTRRGLSAFLDAFRVDSPRDAERCVSKVVLLQWMSDFQGLGAQCLSESFLVLCREVREWIVRQTTVNKRGRKSLLQRLHGLLAKKLDTERETRRELLLYAQSCVGELPELSRATPRAHSHSHSHSHTHTQQRDWERHACAFFVRFALNSASDLHDHLACVCEESVPHGGVSCGEEDVQESVDFQALLCDLHSTAAVLARLDCDGRCDGRCDMQ